MPRKKAVDSDQVVTKPVPSKAKKAVKTFFRGRKTSKAARPATMRKLPNAFRLFVQACKVPLNHWEIFGGIVLIFTLLNVIMIGSFSQTEELQTLKSALNDAITGNFGKLVTGITLYSALIGGGAGTAANGASQAYQSIILVIFSLALIWSLRQVYANQPIRVRDAFYQGMQPLVPFILVLLAIGLRLLPAVFGGFMYGVLIVGGVLQGDAELLYGGLIVFTLLAWSVYMLCSALFAAYIVTLPEMTPLQALRSSKDIVRFRRGSVLRKLLFLPFVIFIISAIIMVPVSLLLTPIAPFVFFLLLIIALPVAHSYMYALYRELIV